MYHLNKDKSWKSYFQLDTKKIAIIALLLSVNMILALFGSYVLIMIPIFGFLVIEITFVTYFVSLYLLNYFYTCIFLIAATWMRIGMGTSEWVGVLSMNLSDLFAITIFASFNVLFKNKIIKEDYMSKKKFVLYNLFSMLIMLILTGVFCVFINWVFILDLYQMPYLKNDPIYLGVVFGFTILKYFINCLLFLALHGVLKSLHARYIY